jgi:hypothetical protein
MVLACWLPSTAAAAPMPAGSYDVAITGGTLDLGNGLLPALPLTSGSKFTAPIGSTPVAQPVGLTVQDVSISGPGLAGSASVTITGAGLTINPADGSATVDASFYVSVSVTGIGSCSFGSPASPLNVHLTTANGSPWDAATGGFTMTDNTFVFDASGCLGGLLSAYLGSTTNVGDNVITIVGSALRQADVVTPPVTTPTTTTTSQPAGGGGSTAPAAGNPSEVTPVTAPAAKSCVVPKLVGKTLKQAKRALKRAGCKAGKSKKASSKKRKKGRIVKQRYKVGTKLPAGAKVPLTISKGPKKARKHRSR